MVNITRMKNYLMAKGMEAVLPMVSEYSPDTLIKMIEKLKDSAIKRMADNHQGDEATKNMRIEAANGFFEMAKENFLISVLRLRKNCVIIFSLIPCI